MDTNDKRLKEIKYQKYLLSMQIRELKKQLKILKEEEKRINEKGYVRKR